MTPVVDHLDAAAVDRISRITVKAFDGKLFGIASMIVVVEDRAHAGAAILSSIQDIGVSGEALSANDMRLLLSDSQMSDPMTLEAVIFGECGDRSSLVKLGRSRYSGPIIVILDCRSLAHTLELFSCGADDVLVAPVHGKELLTRVGVIKERDRSRRTADGGTIQVFGDGRDPLVGGVPMCLPRRERRILECLHNAKHAYLTKDRIFNHVYGMFDDEIDEKVIESHICRLRKRLKERLGCDPIESQRFLGYRLAPGTGIGGRAGTPGHRPTSNVGPDRGRLADPVVAEARP